MQAVPLKIFWNDNSLIFTKINGLDVKTESFFSKTEKIFVNLHTIFNAKKI